MRLSFPTGEHDDILIGAGDTSIGGADDNTIVLKSGGVAAHHARLSVGDRGVVLSILDAQARTHVNTRPVREKALLRLGDIVSLDTIQFVLKPDSDSSIRTDVPPVQSLTPTPPSAAPAPGAPRINPARVLLRGLSGSQFGKIVGVRGKLVIGRGPDADLVLDEQGLSPRHAAIETTGDAIYLRGLNGAEGSFVDGVKVRDAVIYPGDQIAIGRNRFVIEAPGLRPRSEQASAPSASGASPNITQTMKAIQIPLPETPQDRATPAAKPGSKNDIWWLIGAAALIAAGLALLFWVRF
jgi:pSer/pThr/pTyr-binding forkhead associated (FHA) protein